MATAFYPSPQEGTALPHGHGTLRTSKTVKTVLPETKVPLRRQEEIRRKFRHCTSAHDFASHCSQPWDLAFLNFWARTAGNGVAWLLLKHYEQGHPQEDYDYEVISNALVGLI